MWSRFIAWTLTCPIDFQKSSFWLNSSQWVWGTALHTGTSVYMKCSFLLHVVFFITRNKSLSDNAIQERRQGTPDWFGKPLHIVSSRECKEHPVRGYGVAVYFSPKIFANPSKGRHWEKQNKIKTKQNRLEKHEQQQRYCFWCWQGTLSTDSFPLRDGGGW